LAAAVVAQVATAAVNLLHVMQPQLQSHITQLQAHAAPVNAEAIAAAHLFGQPLVRQAQIEAASSDVLRDWVLTGTIAQHDSRTGLAILGGHENQTRLVCVGEQVAPHYSLAEVFSDRVVLRHASEWITLRLKRSLDGLSQDAMAEQPQPRTAGSSTPPPATERPPNFILAAAAFQPGPSLDDDGNYRGFSLSSNEGHGNLAKYGLKDQDIITAVNGHTITSQLGGLKVLKEIKSGVPATVTLLRNGLPTQISVTIDDDGSL
jgi:type II secretion system protein C